MVLHSANGRSAFASPIVGRSPSNANQTFAIRSSFTFYEDAHLKNHPQRASYPAAPPEVCSFVVLFAIHSAHHSLHSSPSPTRGPAGGAGLLFRGSSSPHHVKNVPVLDAVLTTIVGPCLVWVCPGSRSCVCA